MPVSGVSSVGLHHRFHRKNDKHIDFLGKILKRACVIPGRDVNLHRKCVFV